MQERVASTAASSRWLRCVALAAFLAAGATARAGEERWGPWSRPDPAAPLSVRFASEPSTGARSGVFSRLEIRGDSRETVFFTLEVEDSGGRRRRWTGLSLVDGETQGWTIDARAIVRVSFTNVASESERRRARAGKTPPWKAADVILPAGTRSVRFHLVDPYTHSDDREVKVSMFLLQNATDLAASGLTANLGWTVRVYPDRQSVRESGKINAPLYLGRGALDSVPGELLVAGIPLHDGQVVDLRIECIESKRPNFFGLTGLDGQVVIETPRPLWRDQLPYANVKVGLGGYTVVRFAVAPR